MLDAIGVNSIELMTNNPRKVEGLREKGIRVVGRIPVVTAANRFNVDYLLTKQTRSGHWLGIAEAKHRATHATHDDGASAGQGEGARTITGTHG
jgi:hypothetical protein